MKKGFTLIELLAVIVILGVIAIITIPKIQDALYDSQDKSYELLVTEIENKASDYVINNNLSSQITIGSPLEINIQTLIDNGYLEEKDLIDQRSSKDINPNASFVRFTLENGNLVCKANITTK